MQVDDKLNGTVVKNNDTYIVIDNTSLNGLVVSKTVLHPKKETGGHKHPGQEEVYQFVHGHGRIQIDNVYFNVGPEDIILIEDGVFHKVYNDSTVDDLVFICVFDGKRSH
jgi:mannose-6-phosphate isomerase-like protein (cupin superfamily)|tara:strand:- start:709 stop:1038 length:330 start_codon:yes stop_codon:yes gene_type:complete